MCIFNWNSNFGTSFLQGIAYASLVLCALLLSINGLKQKTNILKYKRYVKYPHMLEVVQNFPANDEDGRVEG